MRKFCSWFYSIQKYYLSCILMASRNSSLDTGTCQYSLTFNLLFQLNLFYQFVLCFFRLLLVSRPAKYSLSFHFRVFRNFQNSALRHWNWANVNLYHVTKFSLTCNMFFLCFPVHYFYPQISTFTLVLSSKSLTIVLDCFWLHVFY